MQERSLDDPWWLTEPHQEGQALLVSGDFEGVPWSASLIAGRTSSRDLGWTAVVGVSVGVMSDPDPERAMHRTMSAAHPTTTRPLDVDLLRRVVGRVERTRIEAEATRSTLVAIHDQIEPSRADKVERRRSEQVVIAANIYRLVTQRPGRPKPIPYIAAYLSCRERWAGVLVREARDLGLLPKQARRGYVTPTEAPPTRRRSK